MQVPESGPVYIVNSAVFGENFQSNAYLAVASDLEAGRVELDKAIELTGGATAWALPESGEYYVVETEALVITKYVHGATTRLEEAGRIGLGGAGVSILLGESMLLPGGGKGYLFDLMSAQAIELDLEAMEIVGTTDLGELLNPDAPTFIADPGFRRHGDRFVAFTYSMSTEREFVVSQARAVFFDPERGELELVDSPCPALMYTVAAENGDLYAASDPYVAAVHAIDESRAPAPCMVRLPAGSTQFDAEVVDLNALTGGLPTGGLITASPGQAFVRSFDPAESPVDATSSANELYGLPIWATWRIELDSPEGAEAIDRGLLAGGIKVFEIDGEAYENDSALDFSTTTLVRTTGSDAPAPGLEVPGIALSLVRIR